MESGDGVPIKQAGVGGDTAGPGLPARIVCHQGIRPFILKESEQAG